MGTENKRSHEEVLDVPRNNSRQRNMTVSSLYGKVTSAIFYGLCSTVMAFINKAVVSSYQFDFPFFIMASQMALSICVLEICRNTKCIHLTRFTITDGVNFFWPSLFYAVHAFTALYALSGMSIPMYAAVKRCTPIVILILSALMLQKPAPNINITISVILITVGCILAGAGDLQFDLPAYTYGAVSVIVQGLYLTLMQKSSQSMSTLQILYTNSCNTLPLFMTFTLLHDIRGVISYDEIKDVGFLACFVLQSCMGLLLSFSILLCTANCSALTTSLVGVMKSMLQTIVGAFTFGGIVFNVLNVVGIATNTFGGILYVYLKYREKVMFPVVTDSPLSRV